MDQREAEGQDWPMYGPGRSKQRECTREEQKDKRIGPWMDQREAEKQMNWHVNGPERSRKTRELTCEWTREKQKDKRIGPGMDQREAERQENLGVNGQERSRKTR